MAVPKRKRAVSGSLKEQFPLITESHDQRRQWTYNVTSRPVRVTIIAVEKQEILDILSVCSPSYPACKTCFIVICGLCCSTIFFAHYLINGTIFRKKKILNFKCVFRFSVQILILRRIQRDTTTNVYTSSCKVRLFLSDFNETWIF
jgi:hypothetical protein